MNIGELIKKERKEQKISKLDLSREVGCTTRSIDYWEQGKRNISLENADKILKVLNIKICIGKTSKDDFNTQTK